MATFVGPIKDNQIILVSWVSVSGEAVTRASARSFNGLLDTGAQGTMISRKVVDDVGLKPIGHMPITPVTGEPFEAKKYRIRLDIPIDSAIALPGGEIGQQAVLRGRDMEVALLPYDPSNHDILIGMDLLTGFHLTIFGNLFILSN